MENLCLSLDILEAAHQTVLVLKVLREKLLANLLHGHTVADMADERCICHLFNQTLAELSLTFIIGLFVPIVNRIFVRICLACKLARAAAFACIALPCLAVREFAEGTAGNVGVGHRATKFFVVDGDRIAFDMPNGSHLEIWTTDNIELSSEEEAQAKRDHGVTGDMHIKVNGYEVTVGKDAIIALSKAGEKGTAYHEVLHMAMDILFNDREKAALAKKFGKGRGTVEEHIAEAPQPQDARSGD